MLKYSYFFIWFYLYGDLVFICVHTIVYNDLILQGIQRNEEHFKIWTDHKKRHKKVIEALEQLPLELTINCMVPIGKLAFMKGKLIHTNEILAYLGDNYFAKYSAAQAIALCNHRIQCTYMH